MEDQEEHEHFCDGCGERMEADFHASVQEEKERRHAQDLEDFLQFAADWMAMVAMTASSVEEGLQQEQLLKEAYLKLPEEFFTLAREIEDIGASTWLPCWVQEASGYRDDVAWDARSDAERDLIECNACDQIADYCDPI